jgi:hemerythrin-like domain-containing protein
MTTAFDVLRAEHRRIEQMLAVLEWIAGIVDRGEELPAFFDELLAFFESFADARHHAKEEERLFPILVAGRFAPQYGVIDALKHQHELGRTLVAHMRDDARRLRMGDRQAAFSFAAAARSYTELLRVHIEIEDHEVFPWAEHDLTPDEERVLHDTFVELDGTPAAARNLARWQRLADVAATINR